MFTKKNSYGENKEEENRKTNFNSNLTQNVQEK